MMSYNIAIMVDPSKAEAMKAAQNYFPNVSGNITKHTTHVLVLGGDGFMLSCLQTALNKDFALYGINFGTRGFLMNPLPTQSQWPSVLNKTTESRLYPLHINMVDSHNKNFTFYAFNEVAILRASGQAMKIRIEVDNTVRLSSLMGDGLILSTPVGSSAYNYAAQGPMLPLEANVLPLTPMNAHSPRRWPGALLSNTSKFKFDILEPEKRPAQVSVDGLVYDNILHIEAHMSKSHHSRILLNSDLSLHERLICHQFDL